MVELTAIVAPFTFDICTPHPSPFQGDGGLVVAAIALDQEPFDLHFALASSLPDIDPAVAFSFCSIRDVEGGKHTVTGVSTPDIWACIRDITAVCRGLGF